MSSHFSYAMADEEGINWIESNEVVDAWIDAKGRTYILEGEKHVCPLKWVFVEGSGTLIYRKEDKEIIWSPVPEMLGQVWLLDDDVEDVSMKMLEMMLKYPDDHCVYAGNDNVIASVNDGLPHWISIYDDSGCHVYEHTFVPDDKKPNAREMIAFRLLHMHEIEFKEMEINLKEMEISVGYTCFSWDDEEVHALRFKKGSPYVVQYNAMDSKVMAIISGPGYPEIVQGKIPLGSEALRAKLYLPCHIMGDDSIHIVDAYIPKVIPKPIIL